MALGTKTRILTFLLISLLCSCGVNKHRAEHPGNNKNVYKTVFRAEVPDDVELINCVYVSYTAKWWAVGRYIFPQMPRWALELLAPHSWVEEQKIYWGMRDRFYDRGALDSFQEGITWFKPGVKDYVAWQQESTSIPYVYMYVSHDADRQGKRHVYIGRR